MKPWVLAAGAATSAALGAGYLLSGSALVRELLWTLVLGGSCTAVYFGVRTHRPSRSHPWWILLAAFGLLTVGYLLRYGFPGGELAAQLGGALSIVAYPLVAVAVLALVRLQAPNGDREGAIDGTIVMIALATVLAGTVFDQQRLEPGATVVSRLLMVVGPLCS